MKNFLLFSLILCNGFAFAQDPCDNLDFLSIQYSPFTDTVIIVHVENNSSELFDYPGFVLINSAGDTVAKETVNYFGIGSESVHRLEVRPGVLDPTDDFTGVLQLFTLFYDTLWCEWPLDQSMCADVPCDSVYIGLENWGGALVVGDFEWTVRDENNAVIQSGTFTMEVDPQYWRYGLCLPPGNYSYELEALTEPSGGGPTLTVSSSSSYASPTMSQALDWFNIESSTVSFPFFTFCDESPNGVSDLGNSESHISVRYGSDAIEISSKQLIRHISIYAVTGQTVFQRAINANAFAVPDLVTGSYIAVVTTATGDHSLMLIRP